MSDIELLLRELNERMDKLERKVDSLYNKIKLTVNSTYGVIWGDDSNPGQIRIGEVNPLEIKDPKPNPYEITCKGENK